MPEEWMPEAIGAAVGGAFAAIIAFGVTKWQLLANRRHAIEDRRFGTFMKLIVRLEDLIDSLDEGPEAEAAVHGDINRLRLEWSANNTSSADRRFEMNFEIVLRRLLLLAFMAAPDWDQDGYRSVEFREDGTESQELIDGIFKHGKTWHVDAKRKNRNNAADWFRRRATRSKWKGPFGASA